jgi:uncharacterized 2Fe-2S/4Fe-4S cluster protein (DUF4445 family)
VVSDIADWWSAATRDATLLAGWLVDNSAARACAGLAAIDVAADRSSRKAPAPSCTGAWHGFAGGDHVAALLQPSPSGRAWNQLIMDIGTNTEISLIHGGVIRCASCPSGPALEGGHIGSGMRAAQGAIERVEITDNELRLQVIDGGAPVGLCGSGVLDALAAFVDAGWVDARGRIVAGAHPAIAEVDGVRCITFAEETEERHRLIPAVRLSQHDVRAMQLAKSAIRTGVELLCADAGIAEAAIERFVIAGAFGACIRIASARAVGLVPPLPAERFRQVGNAAGLGVQQMLTSRERRLRAAALARQVHYVELSTRSDFQKTFLHHIGFVP